ncbi:MAG: hypothetical protein GX613_01145 [Chloroflexi bacterium]|nr:hypothetical protein [Chloroflexota bacterium]
MARRRWRWGVVAASLLAIAALIWAWDRWFAAREVDGVTGWVSPAQRDRLRTIFEDGQARGALPGVFTVVGDSISADGRFLKPIVQGQVALGDYGALQAAIDTFSAPNGRGEPSFSAWSWAAEVGWTTEDALNSALNVAGACNAGESPLACEYRTARPSVALITLGTNDVAAGRSPESYRANLRRILDETLAWGVIPVLSTIPPQALGPERDARVSEFNAIVRELAAEHEIPLWDTFAALDALPDRGLSADGVHLNAPPDGRTATFDAEHLAYGVTVRNLGALDALDIVRRALD